MSLDNNSRWFEEFYNLLYDQYLYLCDGGTEYRIKTSKLSLEVAKKENNMDSFLNLDNARKVVTDYFPDLDSERLHDVAKMLYVNAREVQKNNTMPIEMKNLIKERTKNIKAIKLIKVKKD